MTAMAYNYDGFDDFNRQSLSRRQSMAYATSSRSYPYPEQHQGPYQDTIIPSLGGDYPQPSYQIYAPTSGTVALNHRLSGPSFEDLGMRETYYPEDRQIATRPITPMISHGSMSRPRQRRHSTVSYVARPPPIDAYRRPSSIHIKFKRKGAFTAGISLSEAQSHVRLSGNDSYTLHDFHADHRRTILLRVRWAGYNSLTYEIPLESHDGRASLQTLARRVSRACVHYLQANLIPIVWERVELHHLEEISYGVWQPMLSAR